MSKRKTSIRNDTNDLTKFCMSLRVLVHYGEKLSQKDFDSVWRYMVRSCKNETILNKEDKNGNV